MKYHIVICVVSMVPVTVPVGGADVDLGVSGPLCTSYDYSGIEEIRPGITVVFSGGYHLNRSGFPVTQAPALKEQVFPQPVEELFFHDR